MASNLSFLEKNAMRTPSLEELLASADPERLLNRMHSVNTEVTRD